MILAGFDTETTGVDPDRDKIIEAAIILYDYPSKKCLGKYIRRFQPMMSINPDAYAVHGISLDMLADAPLFETEADTILKILGKVNLLVAHNATFDISFLAAELARCGKTLPDIAVLDTMRESPWATEDGKAPKLRELCFATGVPYSTKLAHAAEYDVMRMMEATFAGIEQGYFKGVSELCEGINKRAA